MPAEEAMAAGEPPRKKRKQATQLLQWKEEKPTYKEGIIPTNGTEAWQAAAIATVFNFILVKVFQTLFNEEIAQYIVSLSNVYAQQKMSTGSALLKMK